MSDKLPTIHDVVRVSGKSMGTVSRVINNHPSVSIKAKAAVDSAIKQLGYTPNAIAASLRTRSTKVIGLIVTDISNPFFATVINSIESTLYVAGYSLIVANAHGNSDIEISLIELFIARKVDGLILSLHEEKNPKLFKILSNINIPVVLLDRDVLLPFDIVMTDHKRGMRKAVDYLFDLGHIKIALITVSELTSPGRARVDGYVYAHKMAGIEVDMNLVRCGRLDADYGLQETISLLKHSDRPTALIAGGNQLLPGVLRALRRMDLSIPDDISLISCDDTQLSELSTPSITVIDRDISKMGITAANFLLSRLAEEKGNEQRHAVLDTSLVLRDSCAPINNRNR